MVRVSTRFGQPEHGLLDRESLPLKVHVDLDDLQFCDGIHSAN
jgi:hypothetical protein